MPPPSPGQQINNGALVRVVANTTPGVVPVRATGLLFATVVKYEGRGDYLVKGSGSDGRGSQRRVSGDFLVHQCMDGFGAMFRSDEGCGGSAAPAVSLYFCIARALTQTQILSNGILELHSHISYKCEIAHMS
jgi:hypothetical protein